MVKGRHPLVLRGARGGPNRKALVLALALIIAPGLLFGFHVVALRLPKYFIDILDVFNQSSNQQLQLVQAAFDGLQGV